MKKLEHKALPNFLSLRTEKNKWSSWLLHITTKQAYAICLGIPFENPVSSWQPIGNCKPCYKGICSSCCREPYAFIPSHLQVWVRVSSQVDFVLKTCLYSPFEIFHKRCSWRWVRFFSGSERISCSILSRFSTLWRRHIYVWTAFSTVAVKGIPVSMHPRGPVISMSLPIDGPLIKPEGGIGPTLYFYFSESSRKCILKTLWQPCFNIISSDLN